MVANLWLLFWGCSCSADSCFPRQWTLFSFLFYILSMSLKQYSRKMGNNHTWHNKHGIWTHLLLTNRIKSVGELTSTMGEKEKSDSFPTYLVRCQETAFCKNSIFELETSYFLTKLKVWENSQALWGRGKKKKTKRRKN